MDRCALASPSMPIRSLCVIVGVVLLAGCLGGSPDPVEPGGAAEATPAAPPNGTEIYRPGPADGDPTPVQDPRDSDSFLRGVAIPVEPQPGETSSLETETEALEPTLGAGPEGLLAYSRTLPKVPDWGYLRVSTDGGDSWHDGTPRIAGEASFPPQTNDPFVHVDAETGRIFLAHLQGAACSTMSTSDDGGSTWLHNPVGCGQPPGSQDHPTVWTSEPVTLEPVGYPNLVHYCVNRVVDTACATSVDGGATFGPLSPLVYQTDPTQPFCSSATGHGTATPDGRLLLPRSDCGQPTVALSDDDGITWERVVVSEEVGTWEHPGSGVPDHEVAVAVGAGGVAYASWVGEDRRVYMATSPDGGSSWGPARVVSPPNVETASFPTIAAGPEGEIALAFYGTDAQAPEGEAVNASARWNGYLVRSTDAAGEDPLMVSTRVNEAGSPLAVGPCSADDRCHGVGDFIDVVIDEEGQPWAGFVDVCYDACPEETDRSRPWALAGTIEDAGDR